MARGEKNGRKRRRLEARLAAAEAQIVAKSEFETLLIREIERLTELLRHQPESLLTNLAPLLIGYRQEESRDRVRMPQFPAPDLDTGEQWFPDIEFDESVEGRDAWPSQRTISTTTPQGQTGAIHQVANGRVARTDGQQMFQAGTTGPPPEPERP